MAESGELRPSWVQQKRKSAGFHTVMRIEAGKKVTIRLMDQEPPDEIWKHQSSSPNGTFVKVMCTNTYDDKTKCPLCAVNGHEKYKECSNKERPYPISSENVKAVWVYEEGKAMLLVGSDVWQRIDMHHKAGVDIFARDLSIMRSSSEDRRVMYNVTPLDPSTFKETVNPEEVPKVPEYMEHLKENINRVQIISPDKGGPDAPVQEEKKEPSGYLDGGTSEKKDAPVSSGEGEDKGVRADLMKRFQKLLGASTYNQAVVGKGFDVITAERQVLDKNAAKVSDVTGMNNAEFGRFIDFYEGETKGK